VLSQGTAKRNGVRVAAQSDVRMNAACLLTKRPGGTAFETLSDAIRKRVAGVRIGFTAASAYEMRFTARAAQLPEALLLVQLYNALGGGW
jgi:hypothetical protein